ncbi:hypothetical protein D3C81_2009810 [compost metagenome]
MIFRRYPRVIVFTIPLLEVLILDGELINIRFERRGLIDGIQMFFYPLKQRIDILY